ncbi:MAG: Ppx/GppA family phosphatase [Candidatus Brocadiae bacterium]|nr:Ppx/GppA family phosphatase [Candidatus Brocadiia bacterium]
MKVAAIDIGANSVHLVVSRLFAPGVREVLDRSREMLQLGRATFRTGAIPQADMDRAIGVLKRYRAIAEAQGVEAVLAVATSAVRDARNRGEFVRRAEKEARLSVRVVSGEDEGRLIYLGVRDGLPAGHGRIGVIDIGGGSAELLVGEGEKLKFVRSLKLGVLRMAERLRRRSSRGALEEFIRAELASTCREFRRLGPEAVYGTSGTILALGALLGVRDSGAAIRRGPLEDLSERLLTGSRKSLAALGPVGASRADTIGPGSLVVKVFMEEAGLQEIIPCERALREGVVADYASRNASRLVIHDEEIADPRRRSVMVLSRRLGALDLHATQTTRLALRMFDDLAPLHRLNGPDREVLEFASLLHDAGYWISAEKHHKHAYYLIVHGALEGFSDAERRLVALVARYHRGAVPSEDHEGYGDLGRRDRRKVQVLSAILRIADGLDRSHAALVDDLRCVSDGGDILLEIQANADLDLELYTAGRRADVFREVFRKDIRFAVKKKEAR